MDAGCRRANPLSHVSSAGDGQDRRRVLRVVGRSASADETICETGQRLRPRCRRWRRPPVQDRSARQPARQPDARRRATPITRAESTMTGATSGCRSPSTGPTAARSSTRSIPTTMKPVEVFRFPDSIGAIVHNTDDRTLHGVSWGSRRFYRWTMDAERPRDERRHAAGDAPDAQPVTLRGLSGLQVRGQPPDVVHRSRRTAPDRHRARLQARRPRPRQSRGRPTAASGPGSALDGETART